MSGVAFQIDHLALRARVIFYAHKWRVIIRTIQMLSLFRGWLYIMTHHIWCLKYILRPQLELNHCVIRERSQIVVTKKRRKFSLCINWVGGFPDRLRTLGGVLCRTRDVWLNRIRLFPQRRVAKRRRTRGYASACRRGRGSSYLTTKLRLGFLSRSCEVLT